MTYSRNGLLIILRILLLVVFIIAPVISYYETALIVTPIMFAILAIIISVELIWFLRRQERSMTRFLLSIKHHDFSRNYSKKTHSKELLEAFELITQSFERLETQKHADYRLLQTVSEHIRIGLVCYSPNGEIMFANKTIREMLNLKSFGKMESLLTDNKEVYHCLVKEKPVSGKLIAGKNDQKLLLKTEQFSLKNQQYKLASLYDIRSTLDTNELESYQKLMKVMTHEIMNSATPVLSLIQVVNKKLVLNGRIQTLSDKDQQNIVFSLEAIETQTEGILKFVEAYRQINKEIRPNKQNTKIEDLIKPILTLLIDSSKLNFAFTNKVDEEINIDSGLISQTIINLLKNALEAVAEISNPTVSLKVERTSEYFSMVVEDNGYGVTAENRPEIFVPFYTTKKEGSGIGLALSRKIINAHGGNLTCATTEEGLTQFRILLPKDVFVKELDIVSS